MGFLLIALFFSSCIFFTFKLFNKFNISILPAVATNYLVATAFGYFCRWQTASVSEIVNQPWVLLAVLTGFSFILTFVVFAVTYQTHLCSLKFSV